MLSTQAPLPSSIEQYPQLLSGLAKLSEAEQINHQRSLCRIDLYFLLRYVLGRKDLEHPWLFDRCRMVQASPNGYLDLWARAHYKSTIITFAKTIQDILSAYGDDPLEEWHGREPTFAIFSHTRGIAKDFLTQIKAEFETNELLKDLFPDVLYAEPARQSPQWSTEGITIKRQRNRKESTVEAWGLVDSQPTGKHFDVMIYDDVVTDASVTTPEQIEKTTRAFQVSTNLGSEGSVNRGIGTRWHFADTYRDILRNKTLEARLFAATEDGTFQGTPVFFSDERLAQWVRDQGVSNAASQLMQNPALGSTESFKRNNLRYYTGDINWQGMNRYLLVDPANEKKKDSDYTAAAVIGLAPDHNYYLLDLVRDRLGLRERADMVIHLHKVWERPKVGYEKYGKDSDIEYIQERQKQETYRFDITALPKKGQTNLAKPDRIRRLIPIIDETRFYMPEGLWYTLYDGTPRDLIKALIEEEMLAWPVPIHDDMLDAISRLFDMDTTWPKLLDKPGRRRERYSSDDRRSWLSA